MSPAERMPTAASGDSRLRIGLLASQGDFAAHTEMLRSLGAEAVEVRTPEEIADLDGTAS
jgi:5'-phosphate synthase pdxT subunit